MTKTNQTPDKALRAPRPKPGIMQIAAYVGGASKITGANRVFKLSANESPLGASPAAMAAYATAGDHLELYPDGHSNALKTAIAEVTGFDPAQLIVGSGSGEILSLLGQAYLGAGDEAICTAHGFLLYRIITLSNNAVPVVVPEPDMRADVDALLAAVTPRTKALFLANPSNPLGTYLNEAELKRLHAGLPDDVLLVIDSAYAEYATAADYSDGSSLVQTAENVVMTRTFSKIYGLAALRIGWGLVPTGIEQVIERIRGPFNLSSPAIAAGAAAFRDQDHIAKARDHNARWRTVLSDKLSVLGLNVVPSQANFLLVDFSAMGEGAADRANATLLEGGVIVRDLKNYGLPHALRLTIGTNEANEILISLLTEWISEEKKR